MPSLKDFISQNASALAEALRLKMRPVHDPSRDSAHPGLGSLLREPRGLQGHVISGAVKGFDTRRCILFGTKQGTGKTFMAIATAHLRAAGRPYSVLVVAPPHLTAKWQREIEETIPKAIVIQVRGWKEWLMMARAARKHKLVGPTYFICALTTGKLGARWVPAASTHRRSGELSCPQCFAKLTMRFRTGEVCPATWQYLKKFKRKCHQCKSPLWQCTRPHKIAPSRIIKKYLRGWYDYAILDESHMSRGRTTLAGEAFSHFVSAAKKIMVLTGTLIAGRAEDLRATLFRTMPEKFARLGLKWSDTKEFNDRYGRIESTCISREVAKGTRQWKQQRLRNKIAPGLMPAFYRDFLADCAIFCTLKEMMQGAEMPALVETSEPVSMSMEMAVEYACMKKALMDAYKKLNADDHETALRFLSVIAEVMTTWPDDPSGWPSIGYTDKDGIRHEVYQPRDIAGITPKEKRLLDLIRAERAAGRQVWVFSTRNDTTARLLRLMVEHKLSCAHLTQHVLTSVREKWIRDYGPGTDCVISHPELVATGVELFSAGHGKYGQKFNFATLVHY